MNHKRLTTLLNLSNQVNCADTCSSDLFQYNLVAVAGQEYLNVPYEEQVRIPFSISISRSGEVEISSTSMEAMKGNNIRIYSDRKITQSKEVK